MIEERDSTFIGLAKWTRNDRWTYIEGDYIGSDSLVFRQRDNVLGFGEVADDKWPAKISGDSVYGRFILPQHKNSGTSYKGKIDVNGPPLSNFESDVWKLYMAEKEIKAKHDTLRNQIVKIRRQAREKGVDNPADTDSLEGLKGKYSVELLTLFEPLFEKYFNSADSNIVQRELYKRIGNNIGLTKLDSMQQSKISALLEQYPEGSVLYFRLNKILHLQKLREIQLVNKDNWKDMLLNEDKEFLLSFSNKNLHRKEALEYLYDFVFRVYRLDSSYYTHLMEKVNNMRGYCSEEELEGLEKAISRIEQKSKNSAGAMAPDFSAKSISGKNVNLSSFKGKVVCLEFWASWCGPCRTATPNLKEIQKQFSKDFIMVGIALEDSSSAKKYIDENGVSWLNIAAPYEMDKYQDLYGVSGIPTLFLIDKKGKIAHRTHPFDKDLKNKIAALL